MFTRLSLRTKLQGAVGVLSLFALSICFFLSYELISTAKARKMDLLSLSAQSIADKVDRNLFERYGDVQAFALSEPARSQNPARIEKFMTDMMAAYAPIYDVMLVLDKHGVVLAANTVDKSGKAIAAKSLVGKKYQDEDWFKETVSGKIAAGTAHYTDLRVDEDTRTYAATDGKVMIFSSPIRDVATGEIVGVWSNRMSWKDVVEDIVVKESQKLVDENMPIITGYMVDQDGLFLVNHDQQKVLKEKFNGLQTFQTSTEKSWTHSVEDNDEIKASAFEAVAKNLGYSSYPGKKWTYILRAAESDKTIHFINLASVASFLLISLMAVVTMLIAARASKTLALIIARLRSSSQTVSTNAVEVNQSASDLSSSSAQQAAALQETSASIEEINAMIKKSSDNSARSEKVAEDSSVIAVRGQSSVKKMATAIDDINVSNEAILQQIEHSNTQLGEIGRLISDIGEKTKVINEIVFQTKLLSFNASVEAARAGDAGRGFAVVAEEVGNLARMSGSAAEEIRLMLEKSITRVEDTVRETKDRVQGLVSEGRERVSIGVRIASECGEVLEDVVKNVDELKGMVTEISLATREQSTGMSEIAKAMNELDQATSANSATSQHVSGYAESLSEQSTEMNIVVKNLVEVVLGGSSAGEQSSTSPAQDIPQQYGGPKKIAA